MKNDEFKPRSLDEVMKEHTFRMLKHFGGVQVKTAAALGISERALPERLKRWRKNGEEVVDEVCEKTDTTTKFKPRTAREVEKEHVYRTLEHFRGVKAKAARALGFTTCSLRDRLKRWKKAEEEKT